MSQSTKLLMPQVLDLDNLYAAWHEVRKNRGAAGGDLVTIARFERRLELNILHLAERAARGACQPGKVRMVTVLIGRKWRELAIWCVADRVLQRAVLQVVEPMFERQFHNTSFGYRRGRSVADAVRRIIYLRDRKFVWVVDADIRDCFPSLDHGIVMDLLRRRIFDQDVLDMIEMWLPYGRPRKLRRSGQAVGISLGAVVSPLLCNVYLHELDTALHREHLQSVRYADDFVVLCATEQESRNALDAVRAALSSIRLQTNDEKTRLTNFEEGFTFLGVRFKDRKYRYEWYGKHVESADEGQTMPADIDGYR